MKGCFTKPGKYGSAAGASVEVTEKDVKSEKIFEIDKIYADYFLEAGVFTAGNKKVVEKKTPPKDDKK